MKKLIIALACATALTAITGCENAVKDSGVVKTWTRHNGPCAGVRFYTKVVKIDGHKYVLLDAAQYGGIVHAASCPCNQAK